MSILAIFVMFVLLLLNGFFVAAEFAFTAASRHELEVRQSRSARWAIAAIDELSFTLAGAQLGITICSLLLGAVAEPAVAAFIEAGVGAMIEIPPALLHTISFIIAMSIVVFLHMVMGEMAPKNIAIATPELASLFMALPFRIYATAFRPFIWLLNGMANLGLRLVGIDPNRVGDPHTAGDLPTLIASGHREGIVEDFAHRLLTGAIDLGELEATHVMVPRPDVLALPESSTLAKLEQAFVEEGHSRIPIYREDLDDLVGFVHVKDLLTIEPDDMTGSIRPALLRPLLVVPESAGVDSLLEEMRRKRQHLAAVIDEHGAMAGIVTMEDIVEEIVGEIRDEYDRESPGVTRMAPGRWAIDATLRPSEVRRACEVELPEGEYDTVSGLMMDHLGRIPRVGDRIGGTDWSLQVRSMDGRRVDQVVLVMEQQRASNE